MLNEAAPVPGVQDQVESRTRDRVLHAVSEHGPVTAAGLGEILGLTPTAVRRHLDILAEEGLLEEHELVGRRGRGRPARAYVVSSTGHQTLTSDYDLLAAEALRYLARAAGPEAVADFARQRALEIEDRFRTTLGALADGSATDRVDALVETLTAEGFAASARPVGPTPTTTEGPALHGIQLCQGHCPMQHVATEFPQFCDAETEAFSRVLGVHVQRLATLAQGDHVCTTFIPMPTLPPKTTTERSTS